VSRPLTGLSAWLVQRLSAVYMALFTLVAIGVAAVVPLGDFARWSGLFARPAVTAGVALFFIALLLHCWVGIRDVILDYAGQRPWLRLTLLALLGAWLLLLALWMLRVLLSVSSL
jgi:succinate dehydrogenase / fumarate reductase membrane anchor subunit